MTEHENSPRWAGLAAQFIQAAPPAEERHEFPDRPTAVARIEAALRAQTRSRSHLRWTAALAGGGFAAAAAWLLLFARPGPLVPGAPSPIALEPPARIGAPVATIERLTLRVSEGVGTILSEGGSRPLVAGAELAAGDVVAAGSAASAWVRLTSGVSMHVRRHGRVRVVAPSQRQVLAIAEGAADFDVMKLGPGRALVVATADTEVEVHGTSFSVETVPPDTRCGGGALTRVSVRSGLVAVRHAGREVMLGPGERWPSGCPLVTIPLAPARISAPPIQPEATMSSLLAEQNDLLARAVVAGRAGKVAVARARLKELLERFPAGSLAGSARSLLDELDAGKLP